MATKPPNTSLLEAAKTPVGSTTPAPLTGNANAVSFGFANVPPPSPLYIQRDDVLVVQAVTSQLSESVTFNIRLLQPSGRIEETQIVLGGLAQNVVSTQTASLSEGYLLSVAARSGIGNSRGQTYARAYINRSIFGALMPSQHLFADYVSLRNFAGWPFGRILMPTESSGWVNVETIANPAAGADFTVNVTVNQRWKIRCMSATFTASAAVANRNVTIQVKEAASLVWTGVDGTAVTAGQVINYSIGPLTQETSVIATDKYIPIPPDLVLNSIAGLSGSIGSVTQNIQAGDQWSLIFVLTEEWLDFI